MAKDTNEKSVEMTVGKICGKSVRYETSDPQAIASNIYVNKTFASTMPEKIIVTVKAAG